VVNLFVAVTDNDWFSYLAAQPHLEEVNFWQPGGQTNFKALQPGELFLFKLHSPLNFIVGGGIFAHASLLPVSLSWEAFETRNGAASLQEMRARIARYRRTTNDRQADYQTGCRILEQPFFLSRNKWIPVPPSWSANIVVGKTYSTDEGDGRLLWDAIHEGMSATPIPAGLAEEAPTRFGAPTLIMPRLGQGTFRIAVTDAYRRRCAVTGERTLPVLEAAHIRPYGSGGTHEITNGLLLRSDLHKLFDRGYVTVSPDGHLEVSRRIKEEFENGRYYYGLHGTAISSPERRELRPSHEALSWHANNIFRG
jgi:putative restriction endonuclease